MRHFSKEYGEPHRRYIDPDRMAGECDDQLPLVSKVGRGPRGHGVTPRVRTDQPGEYVVEFVDDVTGEVVLSTANLSAGEISVSVDEGHSPVAGETVMATIHVRLGDETRDYSLPIPPGATGSIFFEVDGEVPPTQDGTYRVDIGRLASWGDLNRPSRPVPRVNDMVVFETPTGFAFGTIEAVANGQVVFTSRTGFELPEFGVTDDGHLTIDGEDTGVTVVGSPGKDAVSPDLTVTREENGVSVVATDHRGTTEAMVLDGHDGVSPTIVTSKIDGGHRLDIDSASGETTIDVMDGTDGEDGLPAVMVTGTVYESDEPKVDITRTSVEGNVYRVDYGLPRGSDGKSVNIHGGVYKVANLPDFDETPVNDAFIVSDYEENEDYRYDLYIRGIEPVIAEEGGPWTVVEDWQGQPGFSVRYLVNMEIDESAPIQIAEALVGNALKPSAHVTDGDLVIDDHGRLGVVGSATDNNGYVTVAYVAKLQVGWDDVLDKPSDLVHTADLTAAIAAEASAREKADQLLETEVDGKLDAADLVAGANVTISPDPETGHVTISATGGGGGASVATTETAGIVRPDGTTVTVDPDGTIHSVGGGSADATDVVRFNGSIGAYQKTEGGNTPLDMFLLFREDAVPGVDLSAGIAVSDLSNSFFSAVTYLDSTVESLDDFHADLFRLDLIQETLDQSDNFLTTYKSGLNYIDGHFVYNDLADTSTSNKTLFVKFFTQKSAESLFTMDPVWTMVPPTTTESSALWPKLLASDGWVDSDTLLLENAVAKPASGDGTSGQMLVTNGDGTTQWVTVPEGTAYSADNATLQLSGTQFSVKDGGITAAKIADGTVTADKMASGVIPDVSGFITETEADTAYAAKSHTHAATQVTGLTASRALMSDESGHPAVSEVTSEELGYLSGVSSPIQIQLSGKAAVGHTHTAATTSTPGFMSAADKSKLDGLSNYELPEATSTTLGGVKVASDEDAKAFFGY